MPQCQFLFSTVFYSRKAEKINILGIGKRSYFTKFRTGRLQKPEGELEGGHRGPTPCPGAPPPSGRAQGRCGPPGPPPGPPFRLFIFPGLKTLKIIANPREKFRRHRHIENQVSGDRSL